MEGKVKKKKKKDSLNVLISVVSIVVARMIYEQVELGKWKSLGVYSMRNI